MSETTLHQSESGEGNLDDQLLADLIRQLSHVADPEQLVEDFCRLHPHLASEVRGIPELQQVLQGISTPIPSHPKQLGDFRIIRQMASGGMGIIYEAIQERLKRRVVLKTMKAVWEAGPTQLRFRREQDVLARLHQTHIVPIHTADEAEGLHFFVMPYIDGASLNHVVEEARNQQGTNDESSATSLPAIAAEWLKKSHASTKPAARVLADRSSQLKQPNTSPLPQSANNRSLPMQYFRSVAQAMADVATGLHYAHQEGLIHRDIKPSNLMIEPNGKCWIIDFGLAGYMRQAESHDSNGCISFESESITQGHIIGTPAYMAPEQWKDPALVDARTDVWGLGITLYELLTLQRAYAGHSNSDSGMQKQQVRLLIEQQPPRYPSDHITNIPADLIAICLKSIQKDQRERYATAMEFAEDLHHWLKCEPTKALPGLHRRLWLWARRHTGWAIAMGLAILALMSALMIVSLTAAQARQQLKQRDREAQIQHLRTMRQSQRSAGWANDQWRFLVPLMAERADPLIRDELAAALVGVDANLIGTVNEGAFSMAFHPQINELLLSGYRESPLLWKSSQEPQSFQVSSLGPVAFDSSQRPVQAVCRDAWTVEVRELNDLNNKSDFTLSFPGNPPPMNSEFRPFVALSSDAQIVSLATKDPDGSFVLAVWDTQSKKFLLQHKEKVTAIAFTPKRGGHLLMATGNEQGQVTLWDCMNSRKLAILTEERDGISALAFGKDPRRSFRSKIPLIPEFDGWLLAVGTKHALTGVWRPAYRQLISRHFGSSETISSLAFHPDGHMIASTGHNQTRLWEVANGRLILQLGTKSLILGAVAFSFDGSRLAVGGVVGFSGPPDTQIFQLNNDRGIKILYGLDNSAHHPTFSRQGNLLAAFTQSQQVAVWQTDNGRLLHLFDTPHCQFSNFCALVFDGEGKRLAFAADTQVVLWEMASGKTLRHWDKLPPGLGNQLAFRPNGELISVRFETQSGQYLPASSSSWKSHPRVCRVRNLFADVPYKSMFEVTEFNEYYFNNLIAPDASYFLVDAIRNTDGKRERWRKIYDGKNFNEIYKEQHGGEITADVGLSTDAQGRHLFIQFAEKSYVISMPECVHLDVKPDRHCISWITPYEARSTPSNMGWHLCQPGNKNPFLRLDSDHLLSHPYIVQKGSLVAWGVSDGYVLLSDLEVIRRRLIEVGQGW